MSADDHDFIRPAGTGQLAQAMLAGVRASLAAVICGTFRDQGQGVADQSWPGGAIMRLLGQEAAPGAGPGLCLEQAQHVPRDLVQPAAPRQVRLDIGQHGAGGVSEHVAGEPFSNLFKRADTAIYTAKRSGRDYAFYDPEQDGASGRSLRLAARLRDALYGGPGLALFYQPRLSLSQDRIVSVEALLQWQDPDDPGALVLSSLAGAAQELDSALIINPYDQDAVADVLAVAGKGLELNGALKKRPIMKSPPIQIT